jgi:hypothetical protein
MLRARPQASRLHCCPIGIFCQNTRHKQGTKRACDLKNRNEFNELLRHNSTSRPSNVKTLRTISFSYQPREDRILAAINASSPEAWACWITRRVALLLLEKGTDVLANASTLVRRAPAHIRGELASFEREAAIANTAIAMSPTPSTVATDNRNSAALLEKVTVSHQGQAFRLELIGETGEGAAAMLTPPELQRILLMLQTEAVKAKWIGASFASLTTPQESQTTPARH